MPSQKNKPSQEEIDHQMKLLAQYRTNLSTLQFQKAQYGSATVPLIIFNGIREARSAILHTKKILRDWEQQVNDHPDDVPTAWAWEEFDVKAFPQVDWDTARQRYLLEMKQLYGSMRMLGMSEPIALEGIFTDIYVLDKPLAWRRHGLDFFQRNQEFADDQFVDQLRRQNALSEIQQKKRLYILGKPGAGKTTLLKYVTIQAVEGHFSAIPIFVSLKSWVDSGLNLLKYLERQFEICSFPNAQPFMNIS